MEPKAVFPEIKDWRINLDCPEKSVYFKSGRAFLADTDPVTRRMAEALAEEGRKALDKSPEAGFSIVIEDHKFRAERMPSGVLAIRSGLERVFSYEELRIPAHYRMVFNHPNFLDPMNDRRGGIICFCGEPGAGKNTTAMAFITQRLKKNLAGYALSYESPIEIDAEGFHGTGYFDQNQVSANDLADAIGRSMRCFPVATKSILYIGEILSLEVAEAVLRVAANGHLVVFSSHGTDITGSIERLCLLLNAERSPVAREILASALRWVIHQQLSPSGELSMYGLHVGLSAQELISNGRFLNLKDELQRTRLFLTEQFENFRPQ